MSVWVCCAKKDHADKLRTELGGSIAVHSRHGLPEGADREASIRAGVEAADVVVVVLSPGLNTDWQRDTSELDLVVHRWSSGEVSVLAWGANTFNVDRDGWPKVGGQPAPIDLWRLAVKDRDWAAITRETLAHVVAAAHATAAVAKAAGVPYVELLRAARDEAQRASLPELALAPEPAAARALAVALHSIAPAVVTQWMDRISAHRIDPVVVIDLAPGPGGTVRASAARDLGTGRYDPLTKAKDDDFGEHAGRVVALAVRQAQQRRAAAGGQVLPEDKWLVRLDGPARLSLRDYPSRTTSTDPRACGARFRALTAWPAFPDDYDRPVYPVGQRFPTPLARGQVAVSKGPDVSPTAPVVVCGPARDWCSCPSVTSHWAHAVRVLCDTDPDTFVDAAFTLVDAPTTADLLAVVREQRAHITHPVIWTDPDYASPSYESLEDA